jgi:hypothetical protein
MGQITKQALVTPQTKINDTQIVEKFSLFDNDGNPISFDDASKIFLTGYTVPTNPTAIAATDDVTTAIGKLRAFTSASKILLTGYTVPTNPSAIAATDDVTTAIGKLMALIDALDARIDALEAA